MSFTRRSFLGWLGGAASAALVAVGVKQQKRLEPLMDPYLTDNKCWWMQAENEPKWIQYSGTQNLTTWAATNPAPDWHTTGDTWYRITGLPNGDFRFDPIEPPEKS